MRRDGSVSSPAKRKATGELSELRQKMRLLEEEYAGLEVLHAQELRQKEADVQAKELSLTEELDTVRAEQSRQTKRLAEKKEQLEEEFAVSAVIELCVVCRKNQ